jgi:hypothetical protein
MMQKLGAYPEFVGFKMTTPQRQALVALAQQEGLTLSSFIRDLIAKEAQRSVVPCGCVAQEQGSNAK